jgi:hypothetical protein
MTKRILTSGLTLQQPTSFKGVNDQITLVSKFNKAWLVDRKNTLTGNVKQFVWAERFILNNYK